nr:PREDICTED: CLOCK-interacting pacemaker-like [Lepisosteus oculatus]XP_015196591.1 PREDICTED: CLOCK-interacting pacemaker-like [Lepisosteus oculatus]XP_015196592.1 PREDICTED: CLOCK-interacting pacemaker-like [Lepisosteus oculatus]
MPQEKQCPGERPPRSASKNAKEKSNSAALRAELGAAGLGRVGGPGSRCESEKDSGYSDGGSDCLQTDPQDQRSGVRQHCGVPGRGAAFGDLTPVYIVKNLVLKQTPSDQILHGQLAWGGQHAVGSASGQPAAQLLFIQQPGAGTGAAAASPGPLKPQPKKAGRDTYLPILHSYPRIAPHPSKGGPAGTAAGGGVPAEALRGHCQSKRVCVEDRREVVTSSELPEQDAKPKPPGLRPAPPGVPPASPPEPSGVGSPSVSSSEAPPQEARAARKHVSNLAKQRRFLNTVEILSHSGLLGITLRTKELIRQSCSTKREIAELRQHTHLLCQAVHTNDPRAWAQLEEAMVSSGHSPDLDRGLCCAARPANTQGKSPRLAGPAAPGLPPEGPGAPPPSPGRAIDLSRRRRAAPLSPLNVPPDSSTHACLS